MLLRGGRSSEPVDLRILGGRGVECAAGLESWERSQSLSVTSRLVARKRLPGDRWYTRWGLSNQPLDGHR